MEKNIVGFAILLLGVGIFFTRARKTVNKIIGSFLRMEWGLPSLLLSLWLLTIIISLINKIV